MSASDLLRVQPTSTDIARPYWDGCREGELRLQFCRNCERFQFYPRIICSHCTGDSLEWRPVSGCGQVASYTVVRRGITRAYEAPYVVALIALQEGPQMMSAIVGAEPGDIAVGAAVAVRFESWGAEHVLPVFVLTD